MNQNLDDLIAKNLRYKMWMRIIIFLVLVLAIALIGVIFILGFGAPLSLIGIALSVLGIIYAKLFEKRKLIISKMIDIEMEEET